MSTFSFNNKIVLEYVSQSKELRSNVKGGVAYLDQSMTLKPLKVLMDAQLPDGRKILAGSTAYIKEHSLITSPWAKQVLHCDTLSSPFIVVDVAHIEFIIEPETPAA